MKSKSLDTAEVPAWSEQARLDFKYAPHWMKACCHAMHFSPKFYAVQTNDHVDSERSDYLTVYLWNSRRVEKLDGYDRKYAEQYLV